MEDRFKTIKELEEDQSIREILVNYIYNFSNREWLNSVQERMVLELANYLYEMGRKGE